MLIIYCATHVQAAPFGTGVAVLPMLEVLVVSYCHMEADLLMIR